MQIDFETFAERVRGELYRGTLPDWQATPLRALIEEGVRRRQGVGRIAYVLATAHHETGRFRWMEEIGQGDGRAYGEDLALMGTGSRVTERRRYHGRGFVQITWLANYAKMSRLIGVDLVSRPELATEPAVAAAIIWEGMIRGAFTGRSLADFIARGDSVRNFTGARAIVNGDDQAARIAGYAEAFLSALEMAQTSAGHAAAAAEPPAVEPADAVAALAYKLKQLEQDVAKLMVASS